MNASEFQRLDLLVLLGQAKSTTLKNNNPIQPEFAEYAKGCGAKGILVTERDQLDSAMLELFAHDDPALLEIKTDVSLI